MSQVKFMAKTWKSDKLTHSLPIGRQNLQVFNESTVNVHNVGSMDNICSACGAFMFKDEKHIGKLSQIDTVTFSGCCANGNIKLPPQSKTLQIC